ncbi:FkbM family methyltransferase [Flavobacteriaceae bacterium TP-CH-4]|uniref:FkbM family methyltransferase n=1 Tax=Pelagihabitans pacificus TaxID=2696054 RepID=A0A967AWV9_9FLAO|nr:FkbM family methyltransferase [Pelagihabitans pacificus]NHF61389.1 FkbM family methyltransferase [Pelagihabitans pacificus]
MANSLKRKLKSSFLRYTGRTSHLKRGVTCDHIWYGDRHAGFFVNPTILQRNAIVYSFGIGENISFDRAIIANHQSHVFAFDPTPKSINWLKSQQLPPNYRYFEYGIAAQSGLVDFYLPKNPNFVSGSLVDQDNVNKNEKVQVPMKSLGDIMSELGHTHIDVLKMDIEGAEYEVINNIMNSDVSITQILIEFHDRFVKNGVRKSKDAISLLKHRGFEIFAVSDNYEEVSLVNTRLLRPTG